MGEGAPLNMFVTRLTVLIDKLPPVNYFYGNAFYIVRRAKLAWLLLVKPLAFFRIQDVIPLLRVF